MKQARRWIARKMAKAVVLIDPDPPITLTTRPITSATNATFSIKWGEGPWIYS
jgi:hypothetical protein